MRDLGGSSQCRKHLQGLLLSCRSSGGFGLELKKGLFTKGIQNCRKGGFPMRSKILPILVLSLFIVGCSETVYLPEGDPVAGRMVFEQLACW